MRFSRRFETSSRNLVTGMVFELSDLRQEMRFKWKCLKDQKAAGDEEDLNPLHVALLENVSNRLRNQVIYISKPLTRLPSSESKMFHLSSQHDRVRLSISSSPHLAKGQSDKLTQDVGVGMTKS